MNLDRTDHANELQNKLTTNINFTAYQMSGHSIVNPCLRIQVTPGAFDGKICRAIQRIDQTICNRVGGFGWWVGGSVSV